MFGLYPPRAPIPLTHQWQGASGQWYCFAVYAFTAVPEWAGSCDYILARPKFDSAGSRVPLYIGESGDFPKEFKNHPKRGAAEQLGATEVHLCFTANSRGERLDLETDLRRGHWTPLNEQPTPALELAFGGLGTLGSWPFGTLSGGIGGGISVMPAPSFPLPSSALAGFGGFGAALDPLGLGAGLDLVPRKEK